MTPPSKPHARERARPPTPSVAGPDVFLPRETPVRKPWDITIPPSPSPRSRKCPTVLPLSCFPRTSHVLCHPSPIVAIQQVDPHEGPLGNHGEKTLGPTKPRISTACPVRRSHRHLCPPTTPSASPIHLLNKKIIRKPLAKSVIPSKLLVKSLLNASKPNGGNRFQFFVERYLVISFSFFFFPCLFLLCFSFCFIGIILAFQLMTLFSFS